MLSKSDLVNYVKQISELEDNMFYVYSACAGKVDDAWIKGVCSKLAKAEARHHMLTKKIKELLKV